LLITAYQFHSIAQTLLGLIDAVRFFQPDRLEDGVIGFVNRELLIVKCSKYKNQIINKFKIVNRE